MGDGPQTEVSTFNEALLAMSDAKLEEFVVY